MNLPFVPWILWVRTFCSLTKKHKSSNSGVMSKGRLTVDWSYKIFRVIYVPREFLSIHNIRESTKKVLRYLPLNFCQLPARKHPLHVIQKVRPLPQLPVLKKHPPTSCDHLPFMTTFVWTKAKKLGINCTGWNSSLHKHHLRHEFAAVISFQNIYLLVCRDPSS